ncbi:MAG: BON domain-containing protein [Armatimonadetes bacterium]|nr:BON domain-containing protein [Armatimonadota bacterium]NIM24242.1 BON domain-containing protein [Armatimonadota bacterium]NIM68111.1 BON domain-containing protein [Armatimonadota bacterium]NIM76573.1 BON domain-containing protein [Armatimonadota bacterium]NIN06316.1 BON domain-containing protein [Armatimonadota bacterium]
MAEDAVLLTKVKEALGKDEMLSGMKVHLRAVGGVIFLDGEAASEDESEAVEALIKEVEGVRWVQNRLQVKAPDTPDDRDPHFHER